VRPRVGEDGSDYPSDIRCGNRRGLAPPERQFDAASVAHGRKGEREKGLQEHGRPDGDDRKAGRPDQVSACSLSQCWRLGVVFWMLIWEMVI
jgi:hypothetical protein